MKYINKSKTEKIKLEKGNYAVIIDFDKTITSFASEDSWDVSGRNLGEEIKKEMTELYVKYRPIELNYEITLEEKTQAMETWYEECMKLYYKYHATKNILQKSVKDSKMQFREGAKEFLQKMNKENTPVIILSAGIGNVIEQFLKLNNCYFDNMYIISNFIEFDENGNVKEFDNRKMIHTLNKTMKNHLPQKWQEELNRKKYMLLFGDLIEDLNMISKKDNAITVGFLENDTHQNFDVYKANFDVVLTGDDAKF